MFYGHIASIGVGAMENVSKQIDLIFAQSPEDLLINVRSHLEKEKLEPLSLNIIKEFNNFCALVVGEGKHIDQGQFRSDHL